MQFQASEFSALADKADYGYEPSFEEILTGKFEGETAKRVSGATIKDIQGTEFDVTKNKITLVATGQSWTPAAGKTWTSIVSNLADVKGNRAKMEAVGINVAAAVAAPKLPPAPSPPAGKPGGAADVQGAVEKAKTPLTQRKWFWPVVILGAAAVVGGAIIFWPGRTPEVAT